MSQMNETGGNVISIPPEYMSIIAIPFLLLLIYYFSKIDRKTTAEHILYISIIVMLLFHVGETLNVVYRNARIKK